MTRTEDFEEMTRNHEWPADLRALHAATNAAYHTWTELDDVVSIYWGMGEDANPAKRGPAAELAGMAYTLLTALRAAGMARLDEWETSQRQMQPDANPYEIFNHITLRPENGDLRVAHVEGRDMPYGVELYYVDGWCPVMSPGDDDLALRFMSRAEAEKWIADGREPEPAGDPGRCTFCSWEGRTISGTCPECGGFLRLQPSAN